MEDHARYDAWVQSHSQGSLWQSLEWKQYQEALGREVRVYVREENGRILASALVVIDRTTGGYSTRDVPRGPLWTANSGERLAVRILEQIVKDAQKKSCLTLFLSPRQKLPAIFSPLIASLRHEQPEATRIIDLTKTEDEILAQMHPKGRYNIRVAQKNGVQVKESDDIEAFYGLLRETARRDGFRVLPLKAYKAFLERLPGSFLLLAYEPPPLTPPPFAGEGSAPSPQQGGRGQGLGAALSRGGKGPGAGGGGIGKPIAGLLGVIWGPTGTYYYGASDYAHRALMAPYALQWEAMRLCKTSGCTKYDLLGIAPPATLSPNPSPAAAGEGGQVMFQHHHWAGVSAFKEKFGGAVITYPPEQQIILRPLLWRALQWKRTIIG